MKHDEFQVKGHRFGNKIRALLRVDLRGAFFVLRKLCPTVNFCKTVNLFLEEKHHGGSYKTITSMKEVPEQEQMLDRLGIPMSNAIEMFLRQIVLQRMLQDRQNGL